MTTTIYDETYVCTYNAMRATEDISAVVDFLRAQTAPVSCREIGLALYGESYRKDTREGRHLISHLGQMLTHLRKGAFIKAETRKGTPIEITADEYVSDYEKTTPQFILVRDDAGNEYQMPNPNFDLWEARRSDGSWQKVKKTIVPTYKVYSWAVE